MRKDFFAYTALGTSTVLAVWTGHAEAQGRRFDWSGPHLGVSAGALFPNGAGAFAYPAGVAGTNNVYFSGNTPYFSNLFSPPVSPVAWPTASGKLGNPDLIGSVGGGYDFQFGSLVIGVAADASFFRSRSFSWTTGTVSDVVNEREHTVSLSGGLENLFSVRPRFGIAIDRLLLFGSGGLAVGHAGINTSAHLYDGDGGYGPGIADWQGSNSGWRFGYMVGGGAELAVTEHLSLTVEGFYYDLGEIGMQATGTGTYATTTPLTVAPYDAKLDLSGALARAGVNMRF